MPSPVPFIQAKVSLKASTKNFSVPSNMTLQQFKQYLMDNMMVSHMRHAIGSDQDHMTLAQLGINSSNIKLFFDNLQHPFDNYVIPPQAPTPIIVNPHSIGLNVNQVTPVDIYGNTTAPVG